MIDKQIEESLDKARKLFNRIQNAMDRERTVTLDVTECVYTLQQLRISFIYRMKDGKYSDEDLAAIDEIKLMAVNADNLIKEL